MSEAPMWAVDRIDELECTVYNLGVEIVHLNDELAKAVRDFNVAREAHDKRMQDVIVLEERLKLLQDAIEECDFEDNGEIEQYIPDGIIKIDTIEKSNALFGD